MAWAVCVEHMRNWGGGRQHSGTYDREQKAEEPIGQRKEISGMAVRKVRPKCNIKYICSGELVT